ncbi:MAG: hypothetical protein PHR44_05365 [Candidatus Omnitrophica bacterium]|nr:hypothetical protein [Candidatus Omnitrophota bacterium]
MAVKRKPSGKKGVKARKPRGQKKPVKKAVRKPTKRTPARKKLKIEGDLIGKVTHYFPHVNAAVLKLLKPLSVGDTIKIKGHTTDFTQAVETMQIDHAPQQSAGKGDEIGLGVRQRVRRKDKVYKI